MKQHLRYAAKLFGERVFFNFLALIMIPVFIPFIANLSFGAALFSVMVCCFYLAIAADMVWKVGQHDRKSYATEKHYALKGLVIGLLGEIPFFVFYIFLLLFPRLLPFYRVLCIGPYMGFVPETHVTPGYGLVLLILPVTAAIAYAFGYRGMKDEKETLRWKILYKNKE